MARAAQPRDEVQEGADEAAADRRRARERLPEQLGLTRRLQPIRHIAPQKGMLSSVYSLSGTGAQLWGRVLRSSRRTVPSFATR